jgi:hypothetical protein
MFGRHARPAFQLNDIDEPPTLFSRRGRLSSDELPLFPVT